MANSPALAFLRPRALACWALGAACLTSGGLCNEPRVTAEAPPRPFLDAEGGVDAVIEASAVEPIGDGLKLLVAHDKAPGLVVVDAASGREVGTPLMLPGLPATLKEGPKWEGMALDSEGNYYVVGSHSGNDAERAERAYLVRFRLAGADDGSVVIDAASVRHWTIAEGLPEALRGLGLGDDAVAHRKIEGLAVRESGGRRELVVGLREPDDRVRALVADITDDPEAKARLALKPLFSFEPGDRDGVRCTLTEIEHVPDLGGFLVVTATEDDSNGFHGNALWLVPDAAIRGGELAATPATLLDFEPAQKAEGLCRLPGRDARLLVTFDNDAKKTHAPSRWQVLRVAPPSR